MSRGAIMTHRQQALREAQAQLMEASIRQFPVDSAVVVLDGAGRRMPCVVKHHCSGSEAGSLCVLPVNNSGRRRSMRTVHWSQVELEGDDD